LKNQSKLRASSNATRVYDVLLHANLDQAAELLQKQCEFKGHVAKWP
jgi:hypothetical protein